MESTLSDLLLRMKNVISNAETNKQKKSPVKDAISNPETEKQANSAVLANSETKKQRNKKSSVKGKLAEAKSTNLRSK